MYDEMADIIEEDKKTMSYDKFITVCVEESLFSDEK